MRAGRMRHRIRIEKATYVKNAFGEPTATWTTLIEVDASIAPQRGSESFDADRPVGQVFWDIRIRDIPLVDEDPKLRAVDVDTNAIYEFTSVVRNHTRNEITINAVSGSKAS